MRRSRSSSITSAKLEYYHRLVSKTILDLQVHYSIKCYFAFCISAILGGVLTIIHTAFDQTIDYESELIRCYLNEQSIYGAS